MRILMAAAVPKRREGGVATMLYNLGRGLQQRGHELTYLFAEDLPGSRNVPQRFADSAFALRLAAYLAAAHFFASPSSTLCYDFARARRTAHPRDVS